MAKKLLRTFAFVLCLVTCITAGAQAIDENGKVVKHISFDRENVTIVYEDGSVRENVQSSLIKYGISTSVEKIEAVDEKEKTEITVYDIQGHRMTNLENLPAGVFIVREGEKVYKLIKK